MTTDPSAPATPPPDRPRVVDLRPRLDQAIKPAELIQITGHQQLTLNARRAITILWHNAHMQGVAEGRDYRIEIDDLKPDGHKGYEMVEEAILALMRTILTVKIPGGRTRRVQFLGGNDLDDPDRAAGTLVYSFDKRLLEVLRDSAIWGKIALPVLMAITSKYVISLYENLAQWSGLTHKTFQEMSLGEFRSLLGVEEGSYPAFGALNKHVIKPAVSEINALAPFGLAILPIKSGKKVTHIRVAWWKKSRAEIADAMAEARRPRAGRKARLATQPDHVTEAWPSVSRRMRRDRLQAGQGAPTASQKPPETSS